MKRIIYISGILLLAAASCAREALIEDVNLIPEGERMVFSADLNPSLKSSFSNDGKTLVWDQDDKVCVGSVKVLGENSFEDPFVFDSMPVDIDGDNPSKASFLSYKKRSYWVGGEEGTEGSIYAFFAFYPASVAGTPQVVQSDENIWIPVEIERHQDGKHFGRYQVCWDFAAGPAEYDDYAYTREQILEGQTVTFNHFRPLSTVLNFNMMFDPEDPHLTNDVAISTIRIYSRWNVDTEGWSYLAGAGAVSPSGVLVPASEVSGLSSTPSIDMVIDLKEPIVVGSSAGENVLAAILPSVEAAAYTLDFEAYDEDGNLRLEGSATSPETGFVAGKKYTFTVKMKEAETTILAMECLRDYPQEGGAYTGRIVSYKYENGERVAVPWDIAFYSDAACTEPVEDITSYDNWIHFNTFVASTEVGVSTAQYGVNANQNIMMIADPVDATASIRQDLRTASPLGTASQPWNLASSNGTQAISTITTANCYIVNQPGYYLIPCVAGNGVKNGDFNTQAYEPIAEDNGESPIFQDYLGTAISNPVIGLNPGNGTPTAAYLLWEDCENLISTSSDFAPAIPEGAPEAVAAAMAAIAPYALELVESEGVYGIKFAISDQTIDQGNAVIAVVDDQNRVMWSWHIWVTDYNPYISANVLPVVSYWSGGEYDVMKRNLGWVLTGVSNKIRYESNHLYVKVWQTVEGGKEITVSLQQLGMELYDADIQHGYCPYWQAGRKDPFTPGFRGSDGYLHDVTTYGAVKALTGQDFVAENRNGNESASHTLKDAIQKPWIYYYNYSSTSGMDGSGWFTDNITSNTSLWNNVLSSELPGLSGGDNPDEDLGTISSIITHTAVSRKTVYDPNPVDFVMPSMDAGGTFFAFFTGGKYENYLSELTGDNLLKERYVSLLISASPYGASFYASLDDKNSASPKTGFLPQVGRRYHMLGGQFQTAGSYPEGSFGTGLGESVYDFARAPNCGGYYSNIVDKGMSAVLLCSYPNMYFGFLTMSTSALPIRSMKEPQQP